MPGSAMNDELAKTRPARTSHEALDDPRNADVLVWINGALAPRAEAVISVFDSGFLLGDGVWEGIRIHNGRFLFLDSHLDRLFEGAAALDLDPGLTRGELTAALHETAEANAMTGGAHARLMVTRGLKSRPFQDPRLSCAGASVVIIMEHNRPDPDLYARGLRLHTAHIRRGAPDTQDPKLNTHSKLNCILALVQALKAGADEALMLDPHGFVSTCNSTNFFIVRRGALWTSTGAYCMNGITRACVLDLCRGLGVPVFERDFSLVDVYGADEAFVTGTVGGLVPVVVVDGRAIGDRRPGPMTARLAAAYAALIDRAAAPAG